ELHHDERVPKIAVRSVRTVRAVLGLRTMVGRIWTTAVFFGHLIGRRVVIMDASDGGLRCFSSRSAPAAVSITGSPGSHYEGPLRLGNDSTAVFVNATR